MDGLEPENEDNSMEWEEDWGVETLGASVGEGTTPSVYPNLTSEYDFSQPSTSRYAVQNKFIFTSSLPPEILKNICNWKPEQEHLSVPKTNLFEHHEVSSGHPTPQPISETMPEQAHISSQETRPNTSATLASGGIDCSKKDISVDTVGNSGPTSCQTEYSSYPDCSVKREMVPRRDRSVVSFDNTGSASGQTGHSSLLDCGGKTGMIRRHLAGEGQQPYTKGRFSEAEASKRNVRLLFLLQKKIEKANKKIETGPWGSKNKNRFYELPYIPAVSHLESHGIFEEWHFLNYFKFDKTYQCLQCEICGLRVSRLPPDDI